MAGKKISQLPSGSLISLPLSGLTAVVHSGITYQHTLNDLRQRLVDSGSHYFTGSQYINGNLTVDGSLTAHEYILSSSITNIEIQNVSGSSYFGNDSTDTHQFYGHVRVTGSVGSVDYLMTDGFVYAKDYLVVGPTGVHHTGSEFEAANISTTSSINIAHFEGNNEYYSQVNITNTNSSSLSSTDIVATADNGNETVHFVNLGINSSTYNGGYVGYENDAYLLNVGKDLYLGTVGGTEHPAQVRLFANNSWENPQIVIHTGSHVTFNTNSLSDGYIYEFSGSVNLHHNLNVIGSTSGSYFTGSFIGDGSGLYNLPIQSTDVSMFLSSSTFASASASFDSRITSATNEQDLSYFATTGSNTFSGSQIVLGDFNIENNFQVFGDSILEGNTVFEGPLTASNGVYSNLIYPLSGSDTITIDSPNLNVDTITANSLVVTGSVSGDGFDKFATTGSNTFIGNQQITGSVYIQEGEGLFVGPGSVFASVEGFTYIQDTSGYIQLDASNNDGSQNYVSVYINANSDESLFNVYDNTPSRINARINLSTSGSFNISTSDNTATLLINDVLYDAHLLSTSSFNIATGSFAITGSNDFVGDQSIDGILYLKDPGNEDPDVAQIVNNGDALYISSQDDRKIVLSVYSGSVYEWQFGTEGDLTVPGNINGAPNLATTGSNMFIGNQTINGSLIIEGVSEVLTIDGGFSGNRDFDYTSGSIFYLTGLTGNGTWNINNVPTTNDRGVTITFVVEQGGTPYSGSAYSFDSTPVTVKWVDSTVPTGSANKTEVIGLTAFRIGSSWNVLGSLSTFGS